MAVRATTRPGCSATTVPMRAALARARGAHGLQHGFGVGLRHEGDQLALVGDVQRVEAQHLAGGLHGRLDRDLALVERDADLGRDRQLVEHGGQPAARGVAQAVDVGRDGQHGRDHAVERRGVADDGRLEGQPFAHGHDRHAVIAHGAADQHHVAGAGAVGAMWMPGGIRPIPVVLMNSPSPWPLLTTLVSPVTSCTPAAWQARPNDAASWPRVSIGSPSSRMNPALRNSGFAPLMARSLTVPLTASSPILPPGKISGLTTNESVVKASRVPSARGSTVEFGQLIEQVVVQRGREEVRDQVAHHLAAAAVAHHDGGVVAQRNRAGPPAEVGLFGIGHRSRFSVRRALK